VIIADVVFVDMNFPAILNDPFPSTAVGI